tara:strand:- start:56 stop:256 length:201 start_codon:yes stop_codon:yes gene_type:complete
MKESPSTVDEINGDFVINNLNELATQYERDTDQVPMSLNIPGPASLRKKTNLSADNFGLAYTVTTG